MKTLVERSLADVGVRGQKFYLAARGEEIDLPHFIQTGELNGVKGISANKYIWAHFSPNVGRDIFFVMNAIDVLKENDVVRVGYNDPDALIANNSKMLGRILSVSSVANGPCDNIIQGVFGKIPEIKKIQGDPIAVANRAQFLATDMQRHRDIEADVDTSKFGDWKNNGLRLSSYDDYANLYYQGAKAAGWYGKDFVKFFSPQNRSQWLPALKAAIVAQANVYSDENEWVNNGSTFIVPKSTLVLLAIPNDYRHGKPELTPSGWRKTSNGIGMAWSDYDQKRLDYYENLMKVFSNGPYRVKIVEAGNTANKLLRQPRESQ